MAGEMDKLFALDERVEAVHLLLSKPHEIPTPVQAEAKYVASLR